MQHPAPFAPGLHAGWCNYLDAAHDAGLVEGFSYAQLWRALGADAARPPDPDSFVEVMHAWYDAGGDPEMSLGRRRGDGYAAVRLGEPMNAMAWLARLVGAAPVLAGVTGDRRPFPALRRDARLERLDVEGGWVQLVDVVDAANALLASRSDERFVPLLVSFEREAYLRLDWARAALLDQHQLLEMEWERSFDDAPFARAA